jgi:hypothetical protein
MNHIKAPITATLMALIAAACSAEIGSVDNEGTQSSQPVNIDPRGATADDAVKQSAQIGQNGARVNMAPTGLRISGDAELLTNVVYEDGSEIAILRIGGGYMLS